MSAYKKMVEKKGGQFKADTHTMKHIKRVATWLTQSPNKRGIYLGGSCGNGKSTMMHAFSLVSDLLGIQVLRTSASKMVTWHLAGNNICDLPYNERVICIDDLGTEQAEVMVFGNKVSVMADFFEAAYNSDCFLFVTSNLGADEIESRYGERVRDRFREIFHSMKFSNESYR